MRLLRLELSGFKSFADNIELPFEDGMTCVVGPNGCGKSNISDAVRWVLGEQRARMLRGARMDEVIFQGSAKRKPLNIAEVSLYFDNGDGTLPIAYQEVVITRRLSRSGQSDYLVNQVPARLKDVQDLLRGTGLGSDAGVVIEARMIDRLLSDKAEERRSLFEEAAGIGLYRDRKRITERRLEKTLEDLQRLDDIINEVQTQVRSLARQRGKAERHTTFTAERFAIVMELARRDLVHLEQTGETAAERRRELQLALPEAREVVGALEREREARVQERATAEAQRTELERRLAASQIEAERLEGDLNLTQERTRHAANRRERALADREQTDATIKQADLEREAAAAELEAAQKARQSVQTELDLRTANEGETRERLSTQRDSVRQLTDEISKHSEKVRSLVGEQTAVERELEDLRVQAAAVEKRRTEAVDRLMELGDRAKTTGAAVENAAQSATDGERALETCRHSLVTAREEESRLLEARRLTTERLSELQARSEALNALERDRAGLAPGAKKLLSARETFGAGQILGPLSDYLRSSSAAAQMAERVLSEWLHAVVVRDESAVTQVRQWHAKAKPGPLLLLPLQPGPKNNHGDDADELRLEVEGEPPELNAMTEADQNGDGKQDDNSLEPQVYILSSGEMTPFAATFLSLQSEYRYHLKATVLGQVSWEIEETL